MRPEARYKAGDVVECIWSGQGDTSWSGLRGEVCRVDHKDDGYVYKVRMFPGQCHRWGRFHESWLRQISPIEILAKEASE